MLLISISVSATQRLVPIVLACVFLLFTACGPAANTRIEDSGISTAVTANTHLLVQLRLPAPDKLDGAGPAGRVLPRSTSLSEGGLLRNGAQFGGALSHNLTAVGNAALYAPAFNSSTDGLGDLALGYYSFDASGYNREEIIMLRWDDPPDNGKNLWVGLANWTGNRWDWFQPASKNQLNLGAQDPISDYISGTGALALALVLTGDTPATLSAIRIGKPLVTMSILSKHWSALAPAFIDFQGAADIGTGLITHYEWDMDGDGDYEYDGSGQPFATTISFPSAGDVDIGLRGTTDWNTTATTTRRLRVLAGDWETQVIANTVNDAEHATFVRTPALLAAGPNDEVPVVVFAQTYWDYTQGEPVGVPTIQLLPASDVHAQGWETSPLQITNPAETNYPYFVDDIARLSGGQPAVIYRDSPSLSDAIQYLHATTPAADTWTVPESLSPNTISGGAGTLEVLDGDLYCAYSSGGGLYERRNAGTLSATWDAAVTIEDPPGAFYKQGKPALGMALGTYQCCGCQTVLAGKTRASAYLGDADGSDWSHNQEFFQQDLDSMAGLSIQAGEYSDPNNGARRLVFAFIDDAFGTLIPGTSVQWSQDDSINVLSTESPIVSSSSLVFSSISLAGGLDNEDHLADLWLAYGINSGGLLAKYYLQGIGWIDLPDVVIPGGTNSGGEPSCIWLDGAPAVAYVDSESQNIVFAVLR